MSRGPPMEAGCARRPSGRRRCRRVRRIESKELYTARSVSNATRDSVVPGAGGETIGLGQIVGQCGPHKPSFQAPIGGLFYVGCDAGGTGVGTQQAIESGMNVAEAAARYHGLRRV